ncbi:hypothetical protein N566_01265 [Streptomycetaceae bacterium MP113-05]|nr:hypothetical protein N566_01265 [Streptomycetaceae bacterium MP113-05]
MTDYGRGPGSQPWHPEDPLYGDQGWNGGQQAGAPGGWETQADPYADPYGGGQYAQGGHQDAAYPADGHYGDGRYAEGGYEDPRYGGSQASGQYGYGDPGHQGPGYENPGYQYPGLHDTGWQQSVPPADPYRHGGQAHGAHPGQPSHPHSQSGWDPAGQHPQQSGPYDVGHAMGATDPYGMQPLPPEPAAGDRTPAGRASGLPRTGPDPDTGWDPGPDQGESAFFSSDGDRDRDGDRDDPQAEDGSGGSRRGGRKKQGGGTKGRSGAACLVVILLLGGVLGAAGWFGYRFYQSHFAAAPDFSGEGQGQVQVEIPDGSSVADMGTALEKAGVVKSAQALVEASAADGSRAQSIQPGVYTLHKEMSAAAAIDMMLDPSSQNSLIIPEGLRASRVFEMIDDQTGSEKGTTEKAAESGDLGLPKWADGRVEGFLYPSRYSVTEDSDPADVLRKMVSRAEAQFKKADLAGQADDLDLESPLEVLTVASLVQAEGKYKHDFVKVSRVVYNRLQPGNTETNGYLQFDSTYNYAKNQSTLKVPSPGTMAKFDHPYNTYAHKGLPPGPVNSPGAEAINAALDPAEGDWFYFVSITEDKTVFSATYEEHQRNVRKYEEAQQ